MSGIEIFSVFGYFMFAMLVMAGAYVFIFGLIYVIHNAYDKTEIWLLTTICFICVMSIYLTCEYSNANLRESRNITESEDVSDNNVGEIKNE